ncbi:MAG: cell division protein FtsQ [Thermoleophilia bacterium]|nr:cell division protein FtsQ [Thermoleophilia bacterium]
MSNAPRNDAAQERRERLRRDRERQRVAQPARTATTAKRVRKAAPQQLRTPAAAVRERHEGLFGWIARRVRAIPSAINAALTGFAREVLGIFGGIGRGVLRAVPGGSLLVRPRTERAAGSAPGNAAAREKSRPIGTDIDGRHARRLSPEEFGRRARRSQLLRRRIRFAVAGVAVVALVTGWIVLPGSSAFRIRHVEVMGASSVSDLEVRARVDTLLEDSTIYTVDADAMQRTIQELPFVESVRVESHFPGGLSLHVTEYQPLALALGDGNSWLVSRDGRILSKAKQEDWKGRIPIVRLRGEKLAPGVRVSDEPALQLLESIPATSSLDFELVELSGKELVGQLVGGVEVRFGRPGGVSNLRTKVVAAELMRDWARYRDKVELTYIDVTVPAKPVWCAASNVACNTPRAPEMPASAAAQGTPETTTDATAPTVSAAPV